MKFNIDDLIIYGSTGVCKVVDIEREAGRNPREYYVLSPVYSKNIVVKIPVDNDKIAMRKIHTRDEVTSLLSNINSEIPAWGEDERARSLQFKSMIRTTDCENLITVIRSIRSDKKLRKLEGKRLYKGDEEMMQAAEKLLNEELSIILGIGQDETSSYIRKHVL